MSSNAAEPGGRNPAPGRLATVQAFLNSVDLEDGQDQFAKTDGLRQWAIDQGLVNGDPRVSEADRQHAIGFREALRDVLAAHSGRDADPAAIRLVNATLGRLTLRVVLDCGASPVLQPAPTADGFERILARLAAIINEAHADGTWKRLRICQRDVCRWVFYDTSKNYSGVWCSMAVCGSRVKAQSYRKRRSQSS